VAFIVALVASLTIAALPANAASGGGCELQGTAAFSPGLTSNSQSFNYSFHGALTSCNSTEAGSPASGQVSAGEVFIDALGFDYQEPVPTGTGSCESGTTQGTAIVTWGDSSRTVVRYSTTAVAAAVHLTGQVIPSVTLNAINPLPGEPTSTVVNTTRYAGNSALGVLAFNADPAACNTPAGVATAGIAGFIGLGTT
jgi:hypothetical protein